MNENKNTKINWYSKSNAITLITLIITIIVMLILAGVIISITTDEDDVFDTAKEATGAWNNRITTEDNAMQNLLAKRNEILGGTSGGGTGGSGETPTEPGETTTAVGSVSLNNTSLTINKGNAQQLTATITPNNATNKNVVWSSSDTTIATVDANGLVTAVSSGTAIITVTTQDGGKTASCTVTVPSTSNLPAGWESSKVAEVITETSTIAGVEKERKAPIPVGYTASKVSTEDEIKEGLVIYQTGTGEAEVTSANHATALTTRNQYVWIPVDDINDMVMCKKNGTTGTGGNTCKLVFDASSNEITCQTHNYTTETPLTDSNIDTTGLAGRLYGTDINCDTTPYTTNMQFTQALKDAHRFSTTEEYREPDIVTICDNSNYGLVLNESSQALGSANALKQQLNNKFIEMAKSVAKYGGFYISRFEPSYDGGLVISQKNKAVLTAATGTNNNYIAGNKWYGLYNKTLNNVEKDASVNSHMIWGCQYDQVIKFLGPEKGETGHNYQTPDQEKTGYDYVDDDENPVVDQDILNNIYDLEGNNLEWTAQASSTYFRVVRGNDYNLANLSYFSPASDCSYNNPTYTDSNYTTRPTLTVAL